MSKHTPGPWRLELEDQARIYGADGFCIVAIQTDDDEYGRPAEEKANAMLITTAPEMYKIISDFIGYYENGPVKWETIDEFFNKFVQVAAKVTAEKDQNHDA